MKHITAWLCLCSGIGVAYLAVPAPAQQTRAPGRHTVDFNDQVRPILSRHCFKCHGPDDKGRKAKLRLDREEGRSRPASSGERPIVPGKPDESELVRRIFADEPDERMPPRSANSHAFRKRAADPQAMGCRRGEVRRCTGRFVKPVRPEIPNVSDRRCVRNPIDAFVLARLDANGMKPSPEADRATLLRRVSLDLVGLPPTPEEVDAFVCRPIA